MVQYRSGLDARFAALADPTRRGILDRLARHDATIGDLAGGFDMTLTGVRKHVRVLEDAGLVATAKVGRARACRLGPERLGDVQGWLEAHRRASEERFDRLEALLQRMKGAS